MPTFMSIELIVFKILHNIIFDHLPQFQPGSRNFLYSNVIQGNFCFINIYRHANFHSVSSVIFKDIAILSFLHMTSQKASRDNDVIKTLVMSYQYQGLLICEVSCQLNLQFSRYYRIYDFTFDLNFNPEVGLFCRAIYEVICLPSPKLCVCQI